MVVNGKRGRARDWGWQGCCLGALKIIVDFTTLMGMKLQQPIFVCPSHFLPCFSLVVTLLCASYSLELKHTSEFDLLKRHVIWDLQSMQLVCEWG